MTVGAIALATTQTSPRLGQDFVAFAFEITANPNPVTLTSITLDSAGTVNEALALGALRLVLDSNFNNTVAAGESTVGAVSSSAFTVDDGSVSVPITVPTTLPAGQAVRFVVVCESVPLSATGLELTQIAGSTIDLQIGAAGAPSGSNAIQAIDGATGQPVPADLVASPGQLPPGPPFNGPGFNPQMSPPLFLELYDHVLISEVAVNSPTGAEFIEIYNPTGQAITLSDYHLTDAVFQGNPGAFYWRISTGMDFETDNTNGGPFDFTVQFPSGAMLDPGQTAIVAIDGDDFFNEFGFRPEYAMRDLPPPPAMGTQTAQMRTATGATAVDALAPLLDDVSEVVILFQWNGATDLVADIDYVIYGGTLFASDKSNQTIGASTYPPETPVANQLPASTPGVSQSLRRTNYLEGGEGAPGSGITGDDETSEPLNSNFTIGVPTPGAAR